MSKFGRNAFTGHVRNLRGLLKQTGMICLCFLLLAQLQPGGLMAQEPQVQASQNQEPQTPKTPLIARADATPSATTPEDLPSAPEPQQAQQNPQSQPAQQPSSSSQQPVGTAAAPYEKPTGVPGSRPAGAAIAPAKQRRVRAIVISVGLLLAGAGAVGAVVGLSKASHSQP